MKGSIKKLPMKIYMHHPTMPCGVGFGAKIGFV